MELFAISCLTFFRSFLLSGSCFIPLIVLKVSLSFAALDQDFPLVSGSFPRNPIISVSCFQSFFSSSGESAIHDSFWRRCISCLKSVIDFVSSKQEEYMEAKNSFKKKKFSKI